MRVELDLPDVRAILGRLAEVFEERKDELNDLDTKIGDGDHGFSMARGFGAVRAHAEGGADKDIGELLMAGGMQFNEAAGSTIGILMFSALREAGKVAAGKTTLRLSDVADMLEAAITGITKRGKATVGQKTILDSLSPALTALREGLSAGEEEAAVVGLRCGRREPVRTPHARCDPQSAEPDGSPTGERARSIPALCPGRS